MASSKFDFLRIPNPINPFMKNFSHENAFAAIKINPKCVVVHAQRLKKKDAGVRDFTLPGTSKAIILKSNAMWEEYAWIEEPDTETGDFYKKPMMYDPSFDIIATKEAWYSMYELKDIKKYSVGEMHNLVSSTGSTGPWLNHRDKPVEIWTGGGSVKNIKG